jgi:hypothetical protein
MKAMDPSPRSHRRLFYLAGAVALLAAGRLWHFGDDSAPRATDTETSHLPLAPPAPPPLRHPPSALAELGVVTDRSEADLARVLDRTALAAQMRATLCGDEAACAAVRSVLRDEHATTLQVVPASAWGLASVDLDANAPSLSPAARASVGKRARIVVVRVATAPSPRQVAIRAAFAAAVAIAEKTDGLVYDQLLGRIETPRDFAKRSVDAPLGASAFRRDRIELLYEPRGEGVVRILTAGLSRWGAPDVEAAAVPAAAAGGMADVVLGVAEAIANGATAGPVTLSRVDLARASGEAYPADPTADASGEPVAIALVSVHPEGGDPNDFMARIEAPGGDGPLSYRDLSERFFGSRAVPGRGEPEGAALPGSAPSPDAH